MDLDQHSGEGLSGWSHVVQSIETILTTRLKTRVFRREFGSELPTMIDAPMNDESLMGLYVAVAEAIATWEPRFELSNVGFEKIGAGVIVLRLDGSYRPQAHLGNYSSVEDEALTVRLQTSGAESWSLAA